MTQESDTTERVGTRVRLALATSVAAIALIGGFLAHLRTGAEESAHRELAATLDRVERRLLSLADAHRTQLERWASDEWIVTEVESLTASARERHALLANPAQARLRKLFSPIVGQYGDPDKPYFGYLIVAPDGVQLASRGTRPVGQKEFYDLDDSIRRAFKGETAVGRPFPSPLPLPTSQGRILSRVTTSMVAAPVRSQDGSIVAVLALRVDPSQRYLPVFEEHDLGRTGRLAALGPDGTAVSRTRIPVNTEPHAAFSAISADGEPDSAVLSYRTAMGGRFQTAIRWNPTLGQALVAEQSETEIFASYERTRDLVLLVGALCGLVAIVFLLGRQAHGDWWKRLTVRRQPVAWAVLAISVIASVWAWQKTRTDFDAREHLRLQRAAERIERAVQERVRAYTDLVRTGRAFWRTAGEVDFDDWQSFVSGLEPRRRFPGASAFALLPTDSKPVLWPPPAANVAITSRYLEKLRRETIEAPPGGSHENFLLQVRDGGLVRLSGALESQGMAESALLAVPVFSGVGTPATLDERRDLLRGWVAAVIDIRQMLEEMMAADERDLKIAVVDISTKEAPLQIYGESDKSESAIKIGKIVEFAGRRWELCFQAEPETTGFAALAEPEQTLLFGLVCSFLIFGLTATLGSTKHRAQALAGAMTTRLRQSEERTRAIVEHAGEGIFITDSLGQIESINTAARELFHYTAQNAVGVSISDLLDERSRDKLTAFLSNPLSIGSRRKLAVSAAEGVRKDGSRFPLEMTMGKVQVGEGARYAAIVRDMTERVRADEERQNLESTMRRAQKLESLGVLAGGIAHDFNNLLVGILGNAGLALMECQADSPATARIQQIETSALRAAELTKQMLAYSGGGNLVVEPVALSELVDEMIDLLEASIPRTVTLERNLPSELPAMLADASQVRQVVMNLITNAAEAFDGAAGRVELTAGVMEADREYLAQSYLQDDLPEGEYVYIEVADDGKGMDSATLSKIFDPFFTTKFTGRGLGLAAALGIVRAHRGAIRVQSKPGEGTTFRVLFPAARGAVKRSSNESPVPAKSSGPGVVLVVDDEEAVREVAGISLEKAGYRVLTAGDGIEALEVYRRHKDEISVVCLDLMMPRMDGVDTFKHLRSEHGRVRVVLASGCSRQEITERFQDQPLTGYLQKPFRPKDLVQAINQAMDWETAA